MNPNVMHLHLENGDLAADVCPVAGGSLGRFEARGQAMLRRAPDLGATDPLEMACYPLIPFSSRVAHARFRFEGRDVTLPPDALSAPHALHGIGWRRAWDVIEEADTQAEIGFTHQPPAHGEKGWPWAFEARQTFALDGTALTIAISIANKAETAMPAGLGLHPFFEGRTTAKLTGDLPRIWEADADCLPTHLAEVTAVRKFARGRRIAPLTLDNCFAGGADPLDIEWEDRPLGLRMTRSDTSHTVIYTPQAHDFFCVEPVTHMPNALNRPEPAEVTGLRVLAPGETMRLECRFEVRGL
ncbi:MAG: aldose 1-epimerase [Parvibaculum sp.]|uniref:aldose 1-epimerase n=1 Tax=Parvibaculum sp. TaxID=2024848 RepID=UPI0026006A00|nr:aldose 1-epimerase [Parvibaculum sp.]MCE9649095.1 aldose 1-epimerase [Parvibaculum sp.]